MRQGLRRSAGLALVLLLLGLLLAMIPAAAFAKNDRVECTKGRGATLDLAKSIAKDKKPDTLKLTPGCVYTLTEPLGGDGNGLPAVDRELTIEGNGATIVRDSATPFRIFYVTGQGKLTLENLTIANGQAPKGGGLYNDGGRVTLLGSTFTGNTATSGGGLYNNGGSLEVYLSRFTGNQAVAASGAKSLGWGGAIYNSGTATVAFSLFSGNTASAGIDSFESGLGGAIANTTAQGHLVLELSTLTSNGAYAAGNTKTAAEQDPNILPDYGNSGWGGGLFNDGGNVTVTRSTISGNTATCEKNGIQSAGGAGIFSRKGTLVVDSSTVSGNKSFSKTPDGSVDQESGIGGGLLNFKGNLKVVNSTLYGNTASGGPGSGSSSGGAIVSEVEPGSGKTATIENSTIANNSVKGYFIPNKGVVPAGGGIFALNGTTSVKNSIVANNTSVWVNVGYTSSPSNCFTFYLAMEMPPGSGNLVVLFSGKVEDKGYNLLTPDAAPQPFRCVFNNTTTQRDVASPGLAAGLDWNGGPTQTLALLTGSPAIDQIPAEQCPATDQRGFKRVGKCDIGAFEYFPGKHW